MVLCLIHPAALAGFSLRFGLDPCMQVMLQGDERWTAFRCQPWEEQQAESTIKSLTRTSFALDKVQPSVQSALVKWSSKV